MSKSNRSTRAPRVALVTQSPVDEVVVVLNSDDLGSLDPKTLRKLLVIGFRNNSISAQDAVVCGLEHGVEFIA